MMVIAPTGDKHELAGTGDRPIAIADVLSGAPGEAIRVVVRAGSRNCTA